MTAKQSHELADPAPLDGGTDRQRVYNSVNRIIDVLNEEMSNLSVGGAIDIDEYSRRKGQQFIELNRIISSARLSDADHRALRGKLVELKRTAEANAANLRSHMLAVEEVVEIFQKAVEREKSDGTYSRGGYGSRWS